jgi:hypothetical protein
VLPHGFLRALHANGILCDAAERRDEWLLSATDIYSGRNAYGRYAYGRYAYGRYAFSRYAYGRHAYGRYAYGRIEASIAEPVAQRGEWGPVQQSQPQSGRRQPRR